MSEELVRQEQQAVTQATTTDKDLLYKMQTFQKIYLQKEPSANEVKKNKFANNSEYLPISFLEMTLDEIFFGLWQTKNFTSKVVANEMVGELELHYFHPIAKTWLVRVGVAGVQIQYEAQKDENGNKKKVDITNISLKIVNTLTKDYPHLKAQCFRNACLSIGKTFGRDLNREFEDQYSPVIKEVKPDPLKQATQRIIEGLAKYDGDDKELLQSMCADKQASGEFTLDLAKEIALKIGVTL